MTFLAALGAMCIVISFVVILVVGLYGIAYLSIELDVLPHWLVPIVVIAWIAICGALLVTFADSRKHQTYKQEAYSVY